MKTEKKRMKYIDADKIKAEIERLRHEWPPTFTEGEKQHLHYYFHGLNKVLRFVESMQQEQPLPPGIENESQKKGWLDYGLTMGEMGCIATMPSTASRSTRNSSTPLPSQTSIMSQNTTSLLVRRKPAAACSAIAWTPVSIRKM